jgi:hypothetical protein
MTRPHATNRTRAEHLLAHLRADLQGLAHMLTVATSVRCEHSGTPDYLVSLECAHEDVRRAVAFVSARAVL